jgi:hypothetical protein
MHWSTKEANINVVLENRGMTLRDYFASSFVASGHVFKLWSPGNTPDEVAEQAYALADAMLKARQE